MTFFQVQQLIIESFVSKLNKKNLKALLQSWTKQGGKILPSFLVPSLQDHWNYLAQIF